MSHLLKVRPPKDFSEDKTLAQIIAKKKKKKKKKKKPRKQTNKTTTKNIVLQTNSREKGSENFRGRSIIIVGKLRWQELKATVLPHPQSESESVHACSFYSSPSPLTCGTENPDIK
jgi:hypothetical protein